MIDLHSHVLHGLDDGPEAVEGSLAIARAAVGAGVRTMVATPHVNRRYPNRHGEIGERATELRERLREEGIELEVPTGAEVAQSQLPDLDTDELERLRLGEGPWLLLECPLRLDAPPIGAAVASLQKGGLRVLLAHPERSPRFQREPEALAALVRGGALTSITAGALNGQFGGTVQRFSHELVAQGLAHSVASDCHDRYHRPPGMAQALSDAGLEPLADWLGTEVPSAILAGAEIPPRPPFQPPARRREAKGWWRRLGRGAASSARG